MIKQLPANLKKDILNLANLNLKESSVPDSWKLAQMTMIPKKGNSSDHSDYRSISLTSCLGKLIERIIQKRLYKYAEKNKLLVDQQSGFRRKRRCVDNLFYLTQKVKENFSRKKKVCSLFFDISKTFDNV